MILLSFDIEEFDLPFEYGLSLSWEEQIRISSEGCRKILSCLSRYKVKATFFCTARFAENAPELIREISESGHEIASHGYAHSAFEEADLKRSKDFLETLTGQCVGGFRMPRMANVSDAALVEAGYTYNSSLNPTFLTAHLVPAERTASTARLNNSEHTFPALLAVFSSPARSPLPTTGAPDIQARRLSAHLLPSVGIHAHTTNQRTTVHRHAQCRK